MAFRGLYEHSLDSKDRLTVPSRFRSSLADGVVLSKGFDPCVWVHTTAEFEQLRRAVPPSGSPDDPVARVRWMLEELRVSLFAQQLGTPRPVSEQRVYKAIDALLA